ncbi:MAG: hypothetical protein K2I79_02750 [Clostridia bacterium]|nr:hypothetical protein [Clostridia bacterium]
MPEPIRKMYNTTYNGAPLNVDVKEWLRGLNDNGQKLLDLAGDVSIDDITVQYKVNGVYEDRFEIDGITGEQAVTVTYLLSAPNHNSHEYDITVNIARARLVISMSGVVRTTYGDDVLTSDELYSEAGIYTNTDLAVDLRDIMTFNVSGDGISAGRYNIGYEFKSGVNRDWFVVSFEANCNENAYIVEQRAINLVWSNDELRYNGAEQAPSLTIDGVLADDTCTATIGGDRGVDAGSYTISVSALSNPNYVIAGDNATISYTILPRVAELTWSNTHFVFNGEERLPTVVVSNLARPTDSCEVVVEGAKVDAGNGVAIAQSLSNRNYTLSSAPEDISVAFEIEQAALRVGWEREGENFVYNGEYQIPVIVISGERYGEDCSAVVAITKADGSEGDGKSAGSYHIVVTGLSNNNFKLANTITLETDYEIAKKEITFEWVVGKLVYTGEEQLPEYRANGIVANEDVEEVFKLSGANTKAGNNYTAVATLKSNNYTVRNGVDKDGVVTVSAAYAIDRANNGFKIEYDRIDWVSGEKPSIETAPEANFGSVTIKYYTDEALTKEYTGAFDENTPEGKYWVVVSTETTDDYIGTTAVYTFEVTSGTKVELYVISIVATIAMLGAGLIVTKTARKKRV